MIVALVALFVALSGVGVAANGGNVILGHSNAATLNTSLSAPVAGGKALQVTNNNTSNAASTALGLNVAAGHAPFTVNSAVKVANLNADSLDGFDSTALQRRVNANCSTGSAIRAIASDGSVTCQSADITPAVGQFTPTQLVQGGVLTCGGVSQAGAQCDTPRLNGALIALSLSSVQRICQTVTGSPSFNAATGTTALDNLFSWNGTSWVLNPVKVGDNYVVFIHC
jgi:hypothetical protein